MNKLKIITIYILYMFSFPSFACGTVTNWMDSYEKVKTNNEWRNNTSQLGALMMLKKCGGRTDLTKAQQERMSRILVDAMRRKNEIINARLMNRDIRSDVRHYQKPIAFNRLIKSIFVHYHCLENVSNEKKSIHALLVSTDCNGGRSGK